MYDDSKGHKIKLAMKIGGEYKIKHVGRKAWVRFADEVGLDPSQVLERCEELALAAPGAFADVAASLDQGFGSSMPAQLAEAVGDAASERLDSLTADNLFPVTGATRRD